MKRIAMSLAIIAFCATVAVSATSAYFSDNTSNLTGITFSTGNADLKITQVCSHQWFDGTVALSTFNAVYDGCQFNMNKSAWYPGKTDSAALYIGNFSTSNIGLDPTIQLTNYSQTVSGLQNVMYLKIWWYGDATGTDWHPLSYYLNSPRALPQLPAPSSQPVNQTTGAGASTKGLNFEMKMDQNASNAYQNGSANFDIHFDASQVH